MLTASNQMRRAMIAALCKFVKTLQPLFEVFCEARPDLRKIWGHK
jgi:hypothetical protein